MFRAIDPRPDFPKLEKKIWQFWQEKRILPKYLSRNKNSPKRFSFLDGPITANNPMGVHHAWGRTLKDLYQRYKNMRGFRQRFQNGFDNQGLWVEVEVEKKLGFKSKKDIEKFGIAKFVEECKKHTLHFAKIQTEQSKRLGYFMDWDNSYFTMSDENNYAIWHFLKKVWQDGNLYKGRDSVPWCPRCGTAISQHEILTEEYKEITHDSVFLKLPVAHSQAPATSFLVWTTTPWTIPGNVALAVNPEVTYVELRIKNEELRGESLVLAKSRLTVINEPYEILREFPGSELEGLRYEGPFDSFERVQAARKENPTTFHTVVLSKDLVSEEEGTGIVHIAPGAGTEDFRLGKEKNLPVIDLIDEGANYHGGLGELSGKNAKEHPELILDHLREHDEGRFLYKIEPFTHRYPVCWRCKTELVWRVVDEWYIAMDGERHPGAKNYRKRLMEVIKDVRWIPKFGYDRELDWLRNMEDWLISKKRYWGLALPIWECECGHFEVIGSKEELKERAVEGWEEFSGHTPHRPFVDRVKIKCPRCGKVISRIPDVGNPWLDAGIVSFSTLKYFEDRDYWREWFPADLVLECFPGQFKNWFYSLLAMSVVLEDTAPFKTLFGHALVRDEHGEEMHKSKGNAIEFSEAAEKMGADVMRWMYARQNPTLNLNFGYGPAEEIKRRFLLILWNCYKFFITYAEIDSWVPMLATGPAAGSPNRAGFGAGVPSSSARDLPRTETGSGRDPLRPRHPSPHVLDRWILSRLNQLIKTVTERLDDYDNAQASKAIEDFVVNELSTWYIRRSRDRLGPTASDGEDKEVCYQTLHQVLLTLTKLLAPFIPFFAEEMYQNLALSSQLSALSSVHLEDWPQANESLIDEELEDQMNLVRQIVEKGHAARKAAGVKVRQPLRKLKAKSQKLKAEFVELIKDELNVKEVEFVEGKGDLEVTLDTKITPELKAEGEARELIRQIQDLRREVGCRLDEEIVVEAPRWPREFEDYIRRKTLASKLRVGPTLKIVR